MMLRGSSYSDIFIKGELLHDMRMEHYQDFHKGDIAIGFSGFRLELSKEEFDNIVKGVKYLSENRQLNVIFENEGDHLNPKYKMRKWVYTRDEDGTTRGKAEDIEE